MAGGPDDAVAATAPERRGRAARKQRKRRGATPGKTGNNKS
jgi:hypothetical protein